MKYCKYCGKALIDEAQFCTVCGAPAPAAPAAPIQIDPLQEEQEFLEKTARFLRWERKAWSICSKVLLIACSIVGALCIFFGIIFPQIDRFFAVLGMLYITEGLIFLLVGIVFGIVCRINANKIPYYIDTLHYDISIARARCTSGGMGALNVIFGGISAIFFFINLNRFNKCPEMVERIIARQKNQ